MDESMTDVPSGLETADEDQDKRLTAIEQQLTALEHRLAAVEEVGATLAATVQRLTAGIPRKAKRSI